MMNSKTVPFQHLHSWLKSGSSSFEFLEILKKTNFSIQSSQNKLIWDRIHKLSYMKITPKKHDITSKTVMENVSFDYPDISNYRLASIVMLIYEKNGEICILVLQKAQRDEKRNANYVHAGQACFPGGLPQRNETLKDCAIRETKEEIGSNLSDFQILNQSLPDFSTAASKTLVKPFIGTIHRKNSQFILQPNEIQDAFEIPMKELLSCYMQNYTVPQVSSNNVTVDYVAQAFQYSKHPNHNLVIWGLTARCMDYFLSILDYNISLETNHSIQSKL